MNEFLHHIMSPPPPAQLPGTDNFVIRLVIYIVSIMNFSNSVDLAVDLL